jgi:hypothetical protein
LALFGRTDHHADAGAHRQKGTGVVKFV